MVSMSNKLEEAADLASLKENISEVVKHCELYNQSLLRMKSVWLISPCHGRQHASQWNVV